MNRCWDWVGKIQSTGEPWWGEPTSAKLLEMLCPKQAYQHTNSHLIKISTPPSSEIPGWPLSSSGFITLGHLDWWMEVALQKDHWPNWQMAAGHSAHALYLPGLLCSILSSLQREAPALKFIAAVSLPNPRKSIGRQNVTKTTARETNAHTETAPAVSHPWQYPCLPHYL